MRSGASAAPFFTNARIEPAPVPSTFAWTACPATPSASARSSCSSAVSLIVATCSVGSHVRGPEHVQVGRLTAVGAARDGHVQDRRARPPRGAAACTGSVSGATRSSSVLARQRCFRIVMRVGPPLSGGSSRSGRSRQRAASSTIGLASSRRRPSGRSRGTERPASSVRTARSRTVSAIASSTPPVHRGGVIARYRSLPGRRAVEPAAPAGGSCATRLTIVARCVDGCRHTMPMGHPARLISQPELLSIAHPILRAAADAIGVRFASRKGSVPPPLHA